MVGVGGGSLSPSSSGNVANITTETVPGGTYGVSARYSGDGKYYASTSNSLNVTVTPESSQMMMGGVSASGYQYITAPLSIGYGEPVPLWVAVAGNSGHGHPTGQISLLVDSQPTEVYASDFQSPSSMTLSYGEQSIVFGNGITPTGQSSVRPNLHSGLPVGTHQIDAAYPGDNSFTGTQASYNINVTKMDSLISDVFFLGTAVPNVPVTVMGQIVLANNGCAPYGGTITILDYTSGSPVVLATGPASDQYCDSFSFPVTFTTTGKHLTRVNFSGDSNVNGTTTTGNLYVSDQSNTSSYFTTFAADNSNAQVGSTVTLTAQIGSDVRQYIATGNVVFMDGATTLGTVRLDATGTATLAVSNFAAGTHNLSANYSGDAVLLGSTGGPISEMISDYTIQAQPSSLTIAAGQSGSATLSIIPLGGSTQTVQLSCGTLPTGIGCSFSPASVTLDGVSASSVKVTVNTSATAARAEIKSRIWGAASTVAFAGILLPFVRRRRLKTVLGVTALLVVALVDVGCGSSGNSSTAHQGVCVLNVTASGGIGSAAKTVPLVVTITK